MAIVTLHKVCPDAETIDCFFCDRSVTTGGPIIVWHGATTAVDLHPECVVELAIRLMRDVWQLECDMGHYVTSRTLPELRRRRRNGGAS